MLFDASKSHRVHVLLLWWYFFSLTSSVEQATFTDNTGHSFTHGSHPWETIRENPPYQMDWFHHYSCNQGVLLFPSVPSTTHCLQYPTLRPKPCFANVFSRTCLFQVISTHLFINMKSTPLFNISKTII